MVLIAVFSWKFPFRVLHRGHSGRNKAEFTIVVRSRRSFVFLKLATSCGHSLNEKNGNGNLKISQLAHLLDREQPSRISYRKFDSSRPESDVGTSDRE